MMVNEAERAPPEVVDASVVAEIPLQPTGTV
jgi:hypothetical protein